jgi:hypothetical protein
VPDDDIKGIGLLDALGESGFTASILATYNIYFPFFEDVVLRRLQSSGCTHNVLMMDARQVAAAYADDGLRPRRAGAEYTLVPVTRQRIFHPKVLLRLGRRKGSLFIGSHNLTLAGFGSNRELTNRFEYGPDDPRRTVTPFRSAIDALRPDLPPGLPAVTNAFEAAVAAAPWLPGPVPIADDVWVLGSVADRSSLWSRVQPLLRGSVRRMLVVGPYFDDDLNFLTHLRQELEADITVAVDPAEVELSMDLATALTGLRFVDLTHLAPAKAQREGDGFLHAKAIWIQTTEGELLVTGSANASAAAWLSSIEKRNAEISVARWSPGTDHTFLDELRLTEVLEAPELTSSAWTQIDERFRERDRSGSGEASVRVMAAEVTGDGIRLAEDVALGVSVAVEDARARELCQATIQRLAEGTGVRLDQVNRESARILRLGSTPPVLAIVHHTDKIADLHASDTRRELRRALGRLDEDPGELNGLLDLLHRAIFDGEEDVAPVPSVPRGGGSADADPGEEGPSTGPDSLEIEVRSKTKAAKQRRRMATGDIAAILDALLRRLGDGLESSESRTEHLEREETTADDDSEGDRPPPEEDGGDIPPEDIAAACQFKVRRLAKRLLKQTEAATEQPDPTSARRAVVQCAAVLAVLFKLRREQERERWRRKWLALIDDKAITTLLRDVLPKYAGGLDSLFARAVDAEGGGHVDEVAEAAAMFVWVAWEAGLDLAEARRTSGDPTAKEDPWPDLQRFAFLAPWVSEAALELCNEAFAKLRRPKLNTKQWLNLHLAWLQEIARAEASADESAAWSAFTTTRPGDLVLLPRAFQPRVRLVRGFDPHRNERAVVTIVDSDGSERMLVGSALRMPAKGSNGQGKSIGGEA